MNTIMRRVLDLPYRLVAMASAASLVASQAHAQTAGGGTGIGAWSDHVKGNFQQVGDLVIAGGFLGGVGLSGAGLLKLKAAADDGGQKVKYSEGLWRLGVGGCLCALPAVTGTGLGTFYDSGASGPSMAKATFQ